MCVAALTMLLHLSQITPALFCTFKQLPPSAMINIPVYTQSNSSNIKNGTGDCMKMCYDDPSCVYVVSSKSSLCSFNPSEGKSYRVSTIENDQGGVVYKLDRNATVTTCPMLEEWLKKNR